MTFHVVGGKLELSSSSLVCRVREGDTLLSCTVSREVLRDLGTCHQLHISEEAVFSQLLPDIERLANERIRAGLVDESGNVTIGTSDLVRYGRLASSIARTSASDDSAELVNDWELARGHLAQAEAAIVDGLRHIAKQRVKIEQLRGAGHDTAYAEDLLLILLDLQHGLEEYSDWLQARLVRMLAGSQVGRITAPGEKMPCLPPGHMGSECLPEGYF